jgi:hypothetical protein
MALEQQVDFMEFEAQIYIDSRGEVSFNMMGSENPNRQRLYIPAGTNICLLPCGGHLLPSQGKLSDKKYVKKVIKKFKANPKFFYKTTRDTEDYLYLMYNMIRIAMETKIDGSSDSGSEADEQDLEIDEQTVFNKYVVPENDDEADYITLSGYVDIYAKNKKIIESMLDYLPRDAKKFDWSNVYIVFRTAYSPNSSVDF